MINFKFFRGIFIIPVLALAFFLCWPAAAYAQGYIPIPTEKLCGDGAFQCPEGDTGVKIARSLTAKIVDNVRYMIGAVAIVMIIISAVKLITAGGNEEVFTKESTTLVFAIVGLFFVGLAGELATIFEVGRGGFLKDPNVALQKSRIFTRTAEIVITFIKYIVGSLAVLMIVRNGLRLVVYGGNEEETGKDKKNIFYAMFGLVVILLSNPIINKVFFKIDTSQYPGIDTVRPGIDTGRLIMEIAALAGPFALLSLVGGGLMYAIAAGDEEKIGKAKKIIIWSLVGIVIIYGAFAIVSTFVARQFEGV